MAIGCLLGPPTHSRCNSAGDLRIGSAAVAPTGKPSRRRPIKIRHLPTQHRMASSWPPTRPGGSRWGPGRTSSSVGSRSRRRTRCWPRPPTSTSASSTASWRPRRRFGGSSARPSATSDSWAAWPWRPSGVAHRRSSQGGGRGRHGRDRRRRPRRRLRVPAAAAPAPPGRSTGRGSGPGRCRPPGRAHRAPAPLAQGHRSPHPHLPGERPDRLPDRPDRLTTCLAWRRRCQEASGASSSRASRNRLRPPQFSRS
jgi:hypothetical protein